MKQLKTLLIVIAISLFFSGCKNTNQDSKENNYNDFKYLEWDVSKIHAGYKNGDFTIVEVVSEFISRIECIDKNGPELNSVILVNPDALSIAAILDEEMTKGIIRGPLHGIPVVIKDNIDTKDNMPNTAGSLALATSFPLSDSFLVKKLREAGAVVIGKTNLSEWANFRGELSSSGWSALGGQTKNPYDLKRNPCGSSSGSGVAVSANLSVIAIGTETNGSIVCPSHANGIVGLKPTVGLVSRSGVIPISFSQDSPGPMARSVRDVAICLGALVGIDSLDSKTLESVGKYHNDYTQFLNENGLNGKRIGIFKTPIGINFKVDELFEEAVEFMKSKGAEIVELEYVTEPKTGQYSFEVMLYEYKDGLNKYFQSLGPNAPIKTIDELIEFNRNNPKELAFFNQKYLEMAAEKGDLNSAEYKDALNKMIKGSRQNGIDKVMNENKLDAIIAPTGSPAWLTDHANGDSFQFGSSSPSAHSGYPIISLPMGFVDELPVGISIFGRAWSEPILLEIAYSYEAGTNHRRVPQFK
ncbi:MAG: amidase [Bacteroidetes bacterium]|nr:amidase [Bacteroidota bacterium]